MYSQRIKFTDQEDEFLKSYVPGHTYKEILSEFEVRFRTITESQLRHRMVRLGVRCGVNSSRFKKGSVPFNKGKKWDEYMSEQGMINSRKHQFTKDSIRPKEFSLGSLSFRERYEHNGRHEKYWYIKYRTGYARDNYMPFHRYVYWKCSGHKPKKGEVIIFLDGDINNCDYDNLQLVTRAELLKLNHSNGIVSNPDVTRINLSIAKLELYIKELEENATNK